MQTRTNKKTWNATSPYSYRANGKKTRLSTNSWASESVKLNSCSRFSIVIYQYKDPPSIPIFHSTFLVERVQGYALLWFFPPLSFYRWYPYVGAKIGVVYVARDSQELSSSPLLLHSPQAFLFGFDFSFRSRNLKEGRFHKSRRSVLVVVRMHGDKELLSHAHKW